MGRIDIGKVTGITLNPDGTVRYISVTGRYYYSPQTRTVIVTDVPNDVAPSDLKGQEVFFRTSDGLRGHSFVKIYNNNKGKTKVFNIGDRVIFNNHTENTLKVGDRVNYPPFGNGIVLETEIAQQNTLVGFDAPPRELHSGINIKYGGTKYERKCWWLTDKDFKVIKEEPKTTKSNTKVTEEKDLTLLIRRKGNKVTCLSLEANDFAKGEAKCSPDDTFNFYTGASLALMRYLNNGGGKGNIE